MATWVASNLRVTVEGKNKRVRATLTASGTYTVGGDAVPAFGAFGLKRNLDYLHISDMMAADGLVYKYDSVAKEIMIYQGDNDAGADGPLAQLTAVSIAGKVLVVEAVGW